MMGRKRMSVPPVLRDAACVAPRDEAGRWFFQTVCEASGFFDAEACRQPSFYRTAFSILPIVLPPVLALW